MIFSDESIESINQNFNDISSGWLWADIDVYDYEYRHIYAQPISVEAATLYDLRFQLSAATIVIRKSETANSEILWAGYCELIQEIPLNPLVWNDKYKTYDLELINGVTQQVGMEFYLPYVHNESGELIENGRAVFITSGTDDDSLHIAKADKGNISGKYVIAVTTQDIANGESGYCTKYGEVRNLDTSNLIANEPFYLDHDGTFTSARADFPDYSTRIGYCTISHPTSGQIYVDVVSETSIEDIYNVQITNPKEGDSFIYENNRWINRNFGDISHDPTGFAAPESVTVSYDESTRCVTLSGTVEAYWRGNVIPVLSAGWCSEPHALGVSGTQFLYYNGTDFIWSSVPWTFDQLQIAAVFYDSKGIYQFTLRECHGIMQHQVHQEFHINIGTYLIAGGDLTNYTLGSTVAANRRPDISQIRIADEDLETTNLGLSSKNYMQFSLSGASADIRFTSANDVVGLTGNQPIVNTYTGGVWGSTPLANNEHAAIFVMTIPQAFDTKSQSKRFVFVQPQTANASLSLIQALSPNDLNLGQIAVQVPEYLFIGKIIVKYQGGNWTLISVEKISGSKANQSLIAGGFLSTVSVGASLSGNGTPASPIDLLDSKTPGTYTKVTTDQYGIVTSGGNLLASDIPNLTQYQNISQKGVANGYAAVDSNNKVFTSAIPDFILGQLKYSGTWNASTNTPLLTTATSTSGNFYIVNVSGTSIPQGLNPTTSASLWPTGNIEWKVGDWIVFDGTYFDKIDNTSEIYSWNGRLGAVVPVAGDYTASQITNIPTVSIISTNVQDAINELDNEKFPSAGGTITGDVHFSNITGGGKGIYGQVGDNDGWRVVGVASTSNNGYLEIATTDDGTEPIYVRQYNNGGGWNNYTGTPRTLTLLDASGNTILPGNLTAVGIQGTTIDIGNVSNTEFQRLDGVSANIQPQFTTLSATKADKSIIISGTNGISGGGDLSQDRTLSLSTTGTAGTYTKVTTDQYGRVTVGTSLLASDIPSGIDASKISTGVVSNTEFNFLDGTSANLQNQLVALSANTALAANRYSTSINIMAGTNLYTITHNLGILRPHIDLFYNNEVIFASPKYIDINTLSITTTVPSTLNSVYIEVFK